MASRGRKARAYYSWLDKAEVDRSIAGGKGASLSRLVSLGARVPKACVITTAAYRKVAASLHLPPRTADVRPDDLPSIRSVIGGAPLPEAVSGAIARIYQVFERVPGAHVSLAVRSSATAEDSASFSFAGLHDTVLGVRSHTGLEAAIRQCWGSLWSDRAVEYRKAAGLDTEDCEIAVVVQQMVRPDVSFVLFTVNPVGDQADEALISASWGLGEAVVSGMVTPDHIVVGPDGRVRRYDIGTKAQMMIVEAPPGEGTRQVTVPRVLQQMPVMTEEQASDIVVIGRALAGRLGYPADIEGGIVDGLVYFFQARPITTLTANDTTLHAAGGTSMRHQLLY